jgi:hypothetical protein
MWIATENVFKDCALGYMPDEEVYGIHIDCEIHIDVDALKRLVEGGDEETERRLSEIMSRLGIPEQYKDRVRNMLKDLIRGELIKRGVKDELWLIDALYRILVALDHALIAGQ